MVYYSNVLKTRIKILYKGEMGVVYPLCSTIGKQSYRPLKCEYSGLCTFHEHARSELNEIFKLLNYNDIYSVHCSKENIVGFIRLGSSLYTNIYSSYNNGIL